jgi:mannose/cellobiose epimerase-like protein (N-acyl-D-glucosamine 2-epimerase family)
MADEIAELALSKFIDPKSGGLREYYDGDWNAAPGVDGRIVEPGHQFEWAWLLLRWGQLAGRDDATRPPCG